MCWYVLQTMTGEEEKLVQMIRRTVPGHLYGECFVVYHEQLWRRQRKNFVHIKRAFPGYVFITSAEPKALFFCLKTLPSMAKLMTNDEAFFLSLAQEEAEFLAQITDEHHVIGLSYLETDGKGRIYQVSGPLASCISQVVCCRFGKRYVLVRIMMLGREKEILLGIILNEDIRQEVRYGKVEAPIQIPEKYGVLQAERQKKTAPINRKENQANLPGREFSVGDLVEVTDGVFRGISAMIYQVKNTTAKIGIRLFGRNLEIELPQKMLRKC